jgi:hypothetical protein
MAGVGCLSRGVAISHPKNGHATGRCYAHGRVDVYSYDDVVGFRPTAHVANFGEGCADACGGGRYALP